MDPLGGEAAASAYKVAFLNAANSPVLRDILLSQRPWLKEFSADSRGGSGASTSGSAPPPTLEALLRHGFNILITDRVKVPSSTPGRLDNLFDLLGPSRSPQLTLVNHLPNSEALTDKGNLVRALNRLLHGSGDVHVFDVIPTTYYLPGGVRSEADSPVLQQFFKRFSAVEHKAAAGAAVRMPEKHCAANVWAIKPVASGSAGGTVICNSAVDIKTYISHIRGDYVIQKYIERPFLVRGRKFSTRLYVLVTDCADIYVYRRGVCHLACEPYTLCTTSQPPTVTLQQLLHVHVPQPAVQRSHPAFGRASAGLPVGNILYLEDLQSYIHETAAGVFPAGVIPQYVLPRMKRMAVDAIRGAFAAALPVAAAYPPQVRHVLSPHAASSVSRLRSVSPGGFGAGTATAVSAGGALGGSGGSGGGGLPFGASGVFGSTTSSSSAGGGGAAAAAPLATPQPTASAAALLSSHPLAGHRGRRSYELFAADFVLDEDLRPWLLGFSDGAADLSPASGAPVDARHAAFIRGMYEELVAVAIDPLFPALPGPQPPVAGRSSGGGAGMTASGLFGDATAAAAGATGGGVGGAGGAPAAAAAAAVAARQAEAYAAAVEGIPTGPAALVATMAAQARLSTAAQMGSADVTPTAATGSGTGSGTDDLFGGRPIDGSSSGGSGSGSTSGASASAVGTRSADGTLALPLWELVYRSLAAEDVEAHEHVAAGEALAKLAGAGASTPSGTGSSSGGGGGFWSSASSVASGATGTGSGSVYFHPRLGELQRHSDIGPLLPPRSRGISTIPPETYAALARTPAPHPLAWWRGEQSLRTGEVLVDAGPPRSANPLLTTPPRVGLAASGGHGGGDGGSVVGGSSVGTGSSFPSFGPPRGRGVSPAGTFGTSSTGRTYPTDTGSGVSPRRGNVSAGGDDDASSGARSRSRLAATASAATAAPYLGIDGVHASASGGRGMLSPGGALGSPAAAASGRSRAASPFPLTPQYAGGASAGAGASASGGHALDFVEPEPGPHPVFSATAGEEQRHFQARDGNAASDASGGHGRRSASVGSATSESRKLRRVRIQEPPEHVEVPGSGRRHSSSHRPGEDDDEHTGGDRDDEGDASASGGHVPTPHHRARQLRSASSGRPHHTAPTASSSAAAASGAASGRAVVHHRRVGAAATAAVPPPMSASTSAAAPPTAPTPLVPIIKHTVPAPPPNRFSHVRSRVNTGQTTTSSASASASSGAAGTANGGSAPGSRSSSITRGSGAALSSSQRSVASTLATGNDTTLLPAGGASGRGGAGVGGSMTATGTGSARSGFARSTSASRVRAAEVAAAPAPVIHRRRAVTPSRAVAAASGAAGGGGGGGGIASGPASRSSSIGRPVASAGGASSAPAPSAPPAAAPPARAASRTHKGQPVADGAGDGYQPAAADRPLASSLSRGSGRPSISAPGDAGSAAAAAGGGSSSGTSSERGFNMLVAALREALGGHASGTSGGGAATSGKGAKAAAAAAAVAAALGLPVPAATGYGSTRGGSAASSPHHHDHDDMFGTGSSVGAGGVFDGSASASGVATLLQRLSPAQPPTVPLQSAPAAAAAAAAPASRIPRMAASDLLQFASNSGDRVFDSGFSFAAAASAAPPPPQQQAPAAKAAPSVTFAVDARASIGTGSDLASSTRAGSGPTFRQNAFAAAAAPPAPAAALAIPPATGGGDFAAALTASLARQGVLSPTAATGRTRSATASTASGASATAGSTHSRTYPFADVLLEADPVTAVTNSAPATSAGVPLPGAAPAAVGGAVGYGGFAARPAPTAAAVAAAAPPLAPPAYDGYQQYLQQYQAAARGYLNR